MIASFPLLGDFPRYPNIDRGVVKALDEFGASIFSNSAGRPPGPTAFQFGMPLITSVILSTDGPSSSDSSSGRGGNGSMISGIEFH